MVTENQYRFEFFKIKSHARCAENPDVGILEWQYRVASFFNKHAPEVIFVPIFIIPTRGVGNEGHLHLGIRGLISRSSASSVRIVRCCFDCQHYPGGVREFQWTQTLPAEIRRRMYLYHQATAFEHWCESWRFCQPAGGRAHCIRFLIERK